MVRRTPNDGQLGFDLPETPGMNPNYLPPLPITEDRTPESIAAEDAAADKHMPGWRESVYGASGKPTPPRRTAAQERNVRAGRFTGAKPEYHPELDGPIAATDQDGKVYPTSIEKGEFGEMVVSVRIDGPVTLGTPLDDLYGAGGEPPKKPPAPPIPDEPDEDDEDDEPISPPHPWMADPHVYAESNREVHERAEELHRDYGTVYEPLAPPESLPYVAGSETSKDAAESMTGSAAAIRSRIDAYLRGRYDGATRQEIEEYLGLAVSTVNPRIVELMEMGLVYAEGRRLTKSKRSAEVLHAVEDRRNLFPRTPNKRKKDRGDESDLSETQLKQANDCRLALAAFMAAYGNCAIPGAIMNLAHKPEAPEGAPRDMSAHDICEVAMMRAWLKGCTALGITLNPNRKGM